IISDCFLFFFSSRRRHTRFSRDWSSDVCSSDLGEAQLADGCIHDPRAAEGVQQALGHLEGAVVAAHLFADQVDAVVSRHLFVEGLVEGLAVHELGHVRLVLLIGRCVVEGLARGSGARSGTLPLPPLRCLPGEARMRRPSERAGDGARWAPKKASAQDLEASAGGSRGSRSHVTSKSLGPGSCGQSTFAPRTRSRGFTSSSPSSTMVSRQSSSSDGSGDASANFTASSTSSLTSLRRVSKTSSDTPLKFFWMCACRRGIGSFFRSSSTSCLVR